MKFLPVMWLGLTLGQGLVAPPARRLVASPYSHRHRRCLSHRHGLRAATAAAMTTAPTVPVAMAAALPSYLISRKLFLASVASVYFVAFLVALRQNKGRHTIG